MTNSPSFTPVNTATTFNQSSAPARVFVRGVRRNSLLPANGDGASLTLDFTQGILDPRLSFARSTNATFVNRSGLVQYADANLMPRSETMDSSPWGLGGVTNTEEQVTNPIGGSSCRLLTVSASGGSKSLVGNMDIAQGFQYTFRIWVRAGTSGSVSIGYYLGAFQSSTLTKVSGPGTVSGSGSGATHHIVNGLTSEWTLLQVTLASATTTGNGAWFIYPNTATNSVGNSIYVWGAQANIGSTANPYYRTTSSAYQAPRFDHDPDGTPRGLQIEGTVENLAKRSQQLNNSSAWLKSADVTISESGAGSPAGDATSNVITWAPNTGSGAAWLTNTITLSPSKPYRWSIWMKGVNGRTVNVFALLAGGLGNREIRVNFASDPPQLTVASESGWTAAEAPTIVKYPNGWYRVQTGATTPSNVTSCDFGFSNFGQVPATGTSGFEAWGFQVTESVTHASYIPTGASSASKAADHCTMDATTFLAPSMYPKTVLADVIPLAPGPGATVADIVRLYARSSSGHGCEIYYYGAGSSGTLQRKVTAATSSDRQLTSSISTYNTRHKYGISVGSDSFIGSADGSTASGTTTAPSALPTATSFHLGVGCNGDSTPGSVMFGSIRQIKLWPVFKSQGELNSLTSL